VFGVLLSLLAAAIGRNLEKGGVIEGHELIEECGEIDDVKMEFALENLLLKMNLN
jgi:hypothetical protein